MNPGESRASLACPGPLETEVMTWAQMGRLESFLVQVIPKANEDKAQKSSAMHVLRTPGHAAKRL